MSELIGDLSCEDAILAVWDYLDDETDETLAARVRRHLEICKRCRERFAFERRFLSSLGRLIDDDTEVTPLRTRIVQSFIDNGRRSSRGA